MNIDEFAHAGGEVLRCPPLGDLHLAPGAVYKTRLFAERLFQIIDHKPALGAVHG